MIGFAIEKCGNEGPAPRAPRDIWTKKKGAMA